MKLEKHLNRIGVLALAGAIGLAASGVANAQTVGDIADSLQGQTTSVATLVSVISFVLGVGMAIAGFMKFKANADNPNDPSNSKSTAFVLLFVGAGLVAVPAALGSGISTIFGDGAQQTDANSGFTQVN